MKAILRSGFLALAIMAQAVPANSGPLEDGKAALDQYDYATAILLFRKAAGQGNADAQAQLGTMYNIGLGAPQSYTEAAKWYRKAAEQGNADAQVSLGHMYAQGRGVPRDYVLAHMWFSLAAARGNLKGLRNRHQISERMTPAQIAKAEKLARDWLEKHKKR